MRWQYKVAVQKTLSLLPGGERANYLLQRHVTKKLPASDAQFFLHFNESVRHIAAFEAHGQRPVQDARTYEFGAGWDLIGPLSLWVLGVSRQVVVDIDSHVRLELINHSIGQLARHHDTLEQRTGRSLRRVDTAAITSPDDLRERFGIDYRAPCDARSTGLPAGSFDLISSTFTLEHIPRDDIAGILAECARLLATGGIVSCSIDMNDHYSFDDPSISRYNFLRYSDRRWRLVNSSLHHQNRLRARDYRELFDAAGLETIDEAFRTPDAEQRAALQALALAPRYARGYTIEELEPYAMAVIATARS
jgi:SAM-dependent methyltransferase